jgi:hypothetical protein
MQVETYETIRYADELATLDRVYADAMALDVTALADWLAAHACDSLLVIGAGGSLSAARLAANFHQQATGRLAKAGTPMDFFHRNTADAGTAGLLLTASGGHSDSLAIARHLARTRGNWAVFCGRTDSPSREILGDRPAAFFPFPILPAVYSWVSVSGLLAQAVTIARAFGKAFPDRIGPLPGRLSDLLPLDTQTVQDAVGALQDKCAAVLARPVLSLLHGVDTAPAADDLDSKFAEAGLGCMMVSDYRNFAHGRYQSLFADQRGYGVLGLYSPRERDIGEATLATIPSGLPHAGLAVPGQNEAAVGVASLLLVLLLTEVVGRVRSLRPGWGSRNTFGDELYEFDLLEYFPLPGPPPAGTG